MKKIKGKDNVHCETTVPARTICKQYDEILTASSYRSPVPAREPAQNPTQSVIGRDNLRIYSQFLASVDAGG